MVIILTIFSIHHQIINVYHLRQNIYWKWKGNYYRIERKKSEGILIFGTCFHELKKRNDPTIKQIDEQNNPVVKHWNGP